MDGQTHSSLWYSPLDPTRREIRLLEIISTSPEVVCRLKVVSLDEKPVFSALSYMWGDPSIKSDIVLNGTALPVTLNLAQALKDVAYHWTNGQFGGGLESKNLWADAVCINQRDDQEKNHQVPLMAAIYSNAESVLSWIGAENKEIHEVFDGYALVEREAAELSENEKGGVEWMRKYPSLFFDSSEPSGESLLQKMNKFTNLRYWKRIWICQEVVLGERIWLVCGTRVLDFKIVQSACSYFHDLQIERRPEFLSVFTWSSLISGMLTIQRIGRGKLVLSGRRFRQDELIGYKGHDVSQSVKFRFSLAFAIHDHYQATDPKDYVYGFLGISGIDLKADYSDSKTVADVYRDYVEKWLLYCSEPHHEPDDLENLGQLFFLNHAGMGYFWETPEGLSSWAPNFVGIANAKKEDRKRFRDLSHRADKGVFTTISEYPRLEKLALCCPIVRVDQLRNLGPRFGLYKPKEQSPILQEAERESERWSSTWLWIIAYITGSPVYQYSSNSALNAIAHIIFQSTSKEPLDVITHNTISFCVWLHMEHYMQCLRKTAPPVLEYMGLRHNSIDEFIRHYVESLLPEENIGSNWPNQSVRSDLPFIKPIQEPADAEVLRVLKIKLQEIVQDRDRLYLSASRFLRSAASIIGLRLAETSNGYIGLFPPRVAENDFVCIFKTFTRPVVIRKVGDHYEIVGSCFVTGLMDGEAAEMVRSGRANTETIKIW
jgi:hypothetical protein